jgi:hypothetical protein
MIWIMAFLGDFGEKILHFHLRGVAHSWSMSALRCGGGEKMRFSTVDGPLSSIGSGIAY